MTRTGVLLVAAVCCCTTVVFTFAGDRGRPNPAAPAAGAAGAIHNRVLDLLDGDVVLEGGDAGASWESEPFSTERFNRIGLRAAVAEESLPVRCQVCWQFDADDACLDGVPLVYAPRAPLVPAPGSDPDQPRPTGLVPLDSIDFTPVRGLSARVRCRIPEVVFVGDDPDAPEATTATLTDVKVLLRRE